MNEQSLLHRSGGRYARKRNSHEVTRTHKQQKRDYPQVTIDLKQKKSKNLVIDSNYNSKISENAGHIYEALANADRKSNTFNHKSQKQNKQQIKLKYLQNTSGFKRSNENRNTLNQYRNQMEQIRQENQFLKDQINTLKQNQDYMQRQLKDYKNQLYDVYSEHKNVKKLLQNKLEQYSKKIQSLYGELIKQKKSRGGKNSQESHRDKQVEQKTPLSSSLGSEFPNRNRIKGEIYSHRNLSREKYLYDVDHHFFQNKFTSPSTYEKGLDNSRNKIDEELYYKQYFKKYEKMGYDDFNRKRRQNLQQMSKPFE